MSDTLTPLRPPSTVELSPRESFDTKVREALPGDDDTDYSGWFCVATNPWPCPNESCDFVALHMTAAHLIVVWPSSDDPMLLAYARDARDLHRLDGIEKPVQEYEPSMGPCIAYDRWVAAGKPIHGAYPTPEGWTGGTSRPL